MNGPDLGEIEAWFDDVLSGRVSRDAADRWAAQWISDDFACRVELDEDQLWALELLCGIDLTHGPGAGLLFSEEQVRGWRDQVRAHRGG
ncbi:hypothetical protein ACIA5G_40420 [Amycolatopsis sp. NPDC051758]|uniref:hypothetical protein n=1 Tax=Amycolatopsis sp. NPDC051758 TaxID=3363935 RepID=UPI0037A3C1FA